MQLPKCITFFHTVVSFQVIQRDNKVSPIDCFIYLFFWLCWVFVAAHGLSLVAVSGGYSSLWYAGFSLWWLLLLRSTGSRRMGFSSHSTRAQQFWPTGLVAPQHVGSSWTRNQTRVPCIGKRILNHCTTSEVPALLITN